MPDCAARTVVSRPELFISGIPRPTAGNWPPTMRGSTRCWAATARAHNTACRCCRIPPRPANLMSRMSRMFQSDLESTAMKLGARVPPLARIADGLAAAVAVALPWSTSATAILIVLWLIALVPTLDAAALRREIMSAAGGLPVLLWALGAIGMLWADVSWSERLGGLSGFHKLLFIPLLLAQFRRRSARAEWVILGFLASS